MGICVCYCRQIEDVDFQQQVWPLRVLDVYVTSTLEPRSTFTAFASLQLPLTDRVTRLWPTVNAPQTAMLRGKPADSILVVAARKNSV